MLSNRLLIAVWGLMLVASCAQAAGVSSNWGLDQISAGRALKLLNPRSEVIVAVIDTGVDIKHPDLKEHIWINPGESGTDSNGHDKQSNGIDDDNNGYVDDVNGWNFVNNTNQVLDEHGHGTHVSGIIAAREHGVSGPIGSVRLMVLKYIAPNVAGYDAVATTIKCIEYAVRMKAQIINYSSGGFTKNKNEEEAIREAARQGVLFVAAAGNEGLDSDKVGYYPANYGIENTIAVTATDQSRKLIPVANFGLNRVLIAAPGKDIVSTMPNGKFGKMTGTSQATAFVTGVAALMMLNNPELRDPEKVIHRMMQTAQVEESLMGKTQSQSVVNAYRALVLQPAGVSAFNMSSINTAFLDPRQFSSNLINEERLIRTIP